MEHEAGKAGWVSGVDSTALNCLGIYSSHIGDSAEQVQICECLQCCDILHWAWETCCVRVNVLHVWSDLTDNITETYWWEVY